MSFLGLTLLAVLVACCCSGCHGQMLSVALPDSNLVLSCPQGQEINIVATSANQAVKSMGNMQGYCANVQDGDCLNPMFLTWAKSVCDNLQECRLPKPDKRMYLCNENNANMVSALYRCENKFPAKRIVIACGGQTASLYCEKGVIRTIKSNYGRLDSNTCTNKPSDVTFCTSGDFSARMKDMCDGQKSCMIPVDPDKMPLASNCDDSPKYVYVSYVCEG